MAGFTNYFEQKVMDFYFGSNGSPYTVPPTLYFGLHNGASLPDLELGTGLTEPAGNYARAPLTNTQPTNWAVSAQVAGEAEKHNTAQITFPTASGANWSTAGQPITAWFIAENSTVNDFTKVLAIGLLSPSKVISIGDTASFAPSAISMTLD